MGAGKLKIVCFTCNWAFDEEQVAASRMQKTRSVVPVMCIGRLDPVTILETFLKGIGGVLLVGCAPPDCHFIEGNIHAQLTVSMLKKLLALTRLEPERLELRWVSPMEETRLIDTIEAFGKKLKKFGASPLAGEKSDADVLENVLAAKNAMAGFRLRALIGKEKELKSGVNSYSERISPEDFDNFANEVVRAEFIRNKILLSTKKKSLSVKELATALEMKPAVVLRQVLNMRRKGMITLDGFEGTTPLYKALEAQ
jgi:F420-non-reducing hydrogenase iron-sulfur subunit